MVVTTSRQGKQVDDSIADGVQLWRKVGTPAGEVPKPGRLEMTVRKYRPGFSGSRNQAFRDPTYRAVRREVEELPMFQGSILPFDMKRPLVRNLLIRPRPGPNRDREVNSLKVEVIARVRVFGDGRGHIGIDFKLAAARDAPDAQMVFSRQPIFRDVAQVLESILAQLLDDAPAVGKKNTDRVLRTILGRAETDERAVVGLMAVIPDLDGRHVAAQHPAKAPDPLRDMVLEFLCLAGQVLELEESAVIAFAGVDETGVDVFEEDSARFVACAAEDPVLDGDILEVVILDAPRRLDFHEAEPAALPHQHVGSREHPLVLECGLEECGVAGSRH